ncbi:MAG: tRNA uridine-5-carboxymethylaminomethyl(34) synthesis GTPase MnmE [Crocinitomicaceae bacterium]|nr:tRNA uridine-5-carboxymethylaminomethyl(34) synthesis GTPase MnmE [Crocinitomicaceae bacterium]
MKFEDPNDTICALSTPQGNGAIALIRLSGKQAINIVNKIFSRELSDKQSHTAHFGSIKQNEQVLDEVLVTIFRNPHSFTGEDLVEIGCHGSVYIQSEILKLLLAQGARMAGPGEFSLRAFINGKMDLSQTEAVADLIASRSAASHKIAMHQMRGGFSKEISELRQELMNFASLIELELDFSEEDVEFADRTQLNDLLDKVKTKVSSLLKSFRYGNALKNGVPVAIVGAPNAGKSTLLNALLNEDKAIVSDIAGTTRDVIEDTMIIDGIEFRFIDTAGIRETKDKIESEGIRKAFDKIKTARIILLLFDTEGSSEQEIIDQISLFEKRSVLPGQKLICLFNKADRIDKEKLLSLKDVGLFISAKRGDELDELKSILVDQIKTGDEQFDTVVTNIRHFEILQKCDSSIEKIKQGLEMNIPGDLLAMDIRETMDLLGEITGEISSDELLGNIFANFCIGK